MRVKTDPTGFLQNAAKEGPVPSFSESQSIFSFGSLFAASVGSPIVLENAIFLLALNSNSPPAVWSPAVDLIRVISPNF